MYYTLFFAISSVHHCSTLKGAFGYFEVTNDISKYCKARVFGQVGKRTPIAVRFSTVGELDCLY